MTDLSELFSALKLADAAGNTDDAIKIADIIRRESAASSFKQTEKDVEPAVAPTAPVAVERKSEDVGTWEGAKAGLRRGFESFGDIGAGLGLGVSSVAGNEAEARRKMEAIKAGKQIQDAAPGMTVEDFERIVQEKGYLAAAKEVPKYILEQLGSSGPQMATPLAVGMAASAVSTPIGGLVAGIGTYALQQFGNFLVTQAQEKKDPKELEVAKAALTAAGTAPFGYFADKFTAGIGSSGKKAISEIYAELGKRGAIKEVAGRAATGATLGIIAEAPVEVLEQAAERWQAGQSLTGPEAWSAYKNAFVGAAAVGASIGAVAKIPGSTSSDAQPPPPPPEAPQIDPDKYSAVIKELTAAIPDSGLTDSSKLGEIFKASGIENEAEVSAYLNQAITSGEIVANSNPVFNVTDANGKVLFNTVEKAVADKAAERLNAEDAGTATVEEALVTKFTKPTEMPRIDSSGNLLAAPLAQGIEVRAGQFKQDMFNISRGDTILNPEPLSAEDVGQKAYRLSKITAGSTEANTKEIEVLQKKIDTNNTSKEKLEAAGEALSPEYATLSAQVNENNALIQAQIDEVKQKGNAFSGDISITPAKESDEGFTLFKQGKPAEYFKTEEDFNQALAAEATAGAAAEATAGSTAGLTGLTAGLTARPTSPDTLNEAREALREKLLPFMKQVGLENTGLRIMDSIENGQGSSDGAYAKNLISISMQAANPMGTVRHETIHALKELESFNKQEWSLLESYAKKQWVNQFLRQRKIGDSNYYDTYKKIYLETNPSIAGFDEYIIEEAIADAFKYFNATKPPANIIGNIYRKVKALLEGLGNQLSGLGFQTADDVFKRVEAGQMKPTRQGETGAAPRYSQTIEESGDKRPFDLKGVRVYEKELQDIIKKVGDRIAGLTSGKTLTDVRAAVKKLQEYAEEGIEGAEWYEKSAKAVLDAFKGDKVLAEKFFQIIAITSAGTEVKANFTMTYNAWNQAALGQPIKVATKLQNKQISDLLNFGLDWNGRKTNSFYLNLMEAMEGVDTGKATIDLHMTRMLFDRDEPTDAQYELAEKMVRLLAAKVNVPPRQIQAASWVTQKAKGLFENYREKGQHKTLNDKELRFHSFQMALVDYSHTLKNKGTEFLPTTKELREPSSDIRARTEVITGEVIPSTKVPAGQVSEIPYKNKLKFNDQLVKAGVVDKIAKVLGLKSKIRVSEGTGGYNKSINPNMIVRVVNFNPTVAKKDADILSDSMSYVFQQDATPYFRADPKLISSGQIGYLVRFNPAKITITQEKKLYKALQEELGDDAGYTKIKGSEILLINFRDKESGKPFLMNDVAFETAVDNFRKKANAIVGIESSTAFGAESEYKYNDWENERTGKAIIERIQDSRANTSDISKGLDDLRNAFIKDAREAVKESGAIPRFSLQDTVYIDGVNRPTTNSSGRPIFGTLEGIKNFWRGFDESKIVDKEGRPLLMYHGTTPPEDGEGIFSQFRSSDDGKMGKGIYTTSIEKYAESFAPSGAVMPLYISMNNPFYINLTSKVIQGKSARTILREQISGTSKDTFDKNYFRLDSKGTTEINNALNNEIQSITDGKRLMDMSGISIQRALKKAGYDGIAVKDSEGNFVEVNAFDSEQVKSATGNRGTFSPKSKDIRYSITSPVWYSELSRQIDKLPQKEMTAAEWKALLVNPAETKSRGVRGADNKVIPGKFITTEIPATSKLPGVKMKEIEDTEILEWLDVAGTSFEVDDYIFALNKKYGEKEAKGPYDVVLVSSAWEDSDLTTDELRTLKSAQSGGRKNTKISTAEVQQFLADGGSKIEFQDRVLGKTPLITKDFLIDKEHDAGIALFETIRKEDAGSIDVVGRKEKVFDDELYVLLEDGKITSEQLPAKYRPLAKAWLAAKKENAEFVESKEEPTQFNAYQLPGGTNYREAFVTVPNADSSGKWVDGHGAYSGINNPVVRIRFNDRVDAEGKKVLFLEELQPPNNPQFEKMPKSLQDRWLAIGLKRMIRHAAEENYDKIAWTTGEQQVERYRDALSQTVDSIEWEKTPEGVHIKGYKVSEFGNFMPEDVFDNANAALRRNDQLGFDTLSQARRGLLDDGLGTAWMDRWDMRGAPAEDIAAMQAYIDAKLTKSPELVADTTYKETDLTQAIGKLMADRIRNDPSQTGTIEGKDLSIDSVGVKKLYDVGVPALANKILKELGGGRVGEVGIRTPKPDSAFIARGPSDTLEKWKADQQTEDKQPGFDITPPLREKAMSGVPRYSITAPDTPEFKRWFGDSYVVGDDGKPLLMYHGTSKDEDYTSFKVGARGAWFGSSPEEASSYANQNDSQGYVYEGRDLVAKNTASRVMPVWLSIKNPYVLTKQDMESLSKGSSYRAAQRNVFSKAKFKGHDGIDMGGGVWVVLNSPTQIKSAIGNKGTFDENKKDIRYSLRDDFITKFGQADLTNLNSKTHVREEVGYAKRLIAAFSPDSRVKLRAQIINRLEAIERQTMKVSVDPRYGGSNELLADVSATAAALQSQRASGIAAESFKRGVPVYANGFTSVSDLNGTVKGLIPIFQPLLNKYKDPMIWQLFQFYSATRRGGRFIYEGREKLFTAADIQKGKDYGVAYPEFDAVFKDYQKYNEGLVKFQVDTGVLTPELGRKWMMYSDYIPFYRQLNGEETLGPKLFQNFSGVKPTPILKGSDVKIADFLETIILNSRSAIENGMKNVASQRIARDAMRTNSPGMTDMARKLMPYEKDAADVIHVRENGVDVRYKVADILLVEAMKGLGTTEMGSMLKFLSYPTKVLRDLVTKDPGFMLANLFRDSAQAYVTSGTNMIPIIDTFKQAAKILANQSPEAKALMAAGIGGGYEFSGDVKASAKAVSAALNDKAGIKTGWQKALWPVSKVWSALEAGTTASDLATRSEIYARVMKSTNGNEAEAVYQALEVMNFGRMGSSPIIQVTSALVPFFNARVQGLDVLYRAGTGRLASASAKTQQKLFARRAMYIMGMSIAYWMLARDTDEWKRASKETRDNNWIIGSVKVPIPFEIGTIFKVLPERILEYTFGNDTGSDLANSAFRNIASTLKMVPVPQAMLPLVEAYWIDYSFFTGNGVVGRGMEKLDPQFQLREGTSLVAKKMGDITGMSPVKIDHVLQGYTGAMGMYVASAISAMIRTEDDGAKASMSLEQTPILKRFFASDKAGGSIDAFYEFKKQVDMVVATQDELQKRGNPEQYIEYMKTNGKLLGAKQLVSNIGDKLSEMRKLRNIVNFSKSMPPDQKRETLDNIRMAEIRLTESVKDIRSMVMQ